MKRSLSTLLIVFILGLGILLPFQVSESKTNCFTPDPDWHGYYRFFKPLGFEALANVKGRYNDNLDANLAAWQKYLKVPLREGSLSEVVYQFSDEDMQIIRAYVSGQSGQIAPKLANNALVKYWKQNPNLDVIDYLFFAKKCEPHNLSKAALEWYGMRKAQDEGTMRWLADNGPKYYQSKGSDNFLKTRFAYQAIKMAHYVGDYQKAIQLYDQLVAPIFEQSQDITKYWALGHKAGALYSLGRRGEAAYWFSRVFAECPSRHTTAFQSFRVSNGAEWEDAMRLCRNNQEKANLHFMRSLKSTANGVAEMENVFRLAPDFEQLPYMLAYEIRDLERKLLDRISKHNILFHDQPQQFDKQPVLKRLEALKSLALRFVNSGKVQKPELWHMGIGYMDYLMGRHDAAQKYYAQARQQNPEQAAQIKVLELALALGRLRQVDKVAETELYQAIQATGNEDLMLLCKRIFAQHYERQGEPGKAFMSVYSFYDLKLKRPKAAIQDLLRVTSKGLHTPYEKEVILMNIYPNIDFQARNTSPENLIKELWATVLFSEDRLEEAQKFYQQIPKEQQYKIQADPFVLYTHDRRYYPGHQREYTRGEVLNEILALKSARRPNAETQLRLANAYYNLSYFGKGWLIFAYHRSGAPYNTEWHYDYTDLSLARKYYEEAIQLAERQRENEVAARAIYGLAKCEQAKLGVFAAPDYGQLRRSFKDMKLYRETEFYQQAIDECFYFQNIADY